MIQVTIVFDIKCKWNEFQYTKFFHKLIRPIIELKECMWYEVREIE